MAKLIEGIPGRNYEEDIDIWEDDAYLIGDDPDTEDINLLEDMVDYSVDNTKTPAHVKILLKDGNFVVVSMNKRELRAYEKSADTIFNERPLTSEDIKVMESTYTPGQKKLAKIIKMVIYGWIIVVVAILLKSCIGGAP